LSSPFLRHSQVVSPVGLFLVSVFCFSSETFISEAPVPVYSLLISGIPLRFSPRFFCFLWFHITLTLLVLSSVDYRPTARFCLAVVIPWFFLNHIRIRRPPRLNLSPFEVMAFHRYPLPTPPPRFTSFLLSDTFLILSQLVCPPGFTWAFSTKPAF